MVAICDRTAALTEVWMLSHLGELKNTWDSIPDPSMYYKWHFKRSFKNHK
jgi:hypothetical protein